MLDQSSAERRRLGLELIDPKPVALGFLLNDVDPGERAARLRELRALATVYLGAGHPTTRALAQVIEDGVSEAQALQLVDVLPALVRSIGCTRLFRSVVSAGG